MKHRLPVLPTPAGVPEISRAACACSTSPWQCPRHMPVAYSKWDAKHRADAEAA